MGIYFVRHGQTDWNLKGKMQGKADIPLNATGREQARITKEKLQNIKMDYIYCSPLQRAKETAMIINENWGLDIQEEVLIQERDFGVYEGQYSHELDFDELWKPSSIAPFEKAEDTNSFYQRVEDFLDQIIEVAQEKNILLVAHGGVSIPYHCYFYGYGFEKLNEIMLANCEVSYMDGKKLDCVQRG